MAHAKMKVSEDLQLCAAMSVMEEKILTMQQVIEGKVNY